MRSTLFTHLLFVYVFFLFTTVGTLFWAAFSMGCYHKFYNKQLGKVIIVYQTFPKSQVLIQLLKVLFKLITVISVKYSADT